MTGITGLGREPGGGARTARLPVEEVSDRLRRRLAQLWLEGSLAVAAAGIMVWCASGISVDPLDRVGQVSALASLSLVFTVLVLVALVPTSLERRLPAPAAGWTACAAAVLAGATSGFVAGGVLVALDGTKWGLFADAGDARILADWAEQLLEGGTMPGDYPPGYVWALALLSDVTSSPPGYALKGLQIIVTALLGPVGYLAWRTIAGPMQALLIGVIAALPLIEPYKPVTNLTLVVLIPLLVILVDGVGRAGTAPRAPRLARGAVVGLLLGVVALTYSGWFVWSAPGIVVLVACVLPWRDGRAAMAASLEYLGAAAAGFLLVSAVHVFPLLAAAGGTEDSYLYFDALVDPAYFAMWRNDLPGNVGPWPPPGELGGVGLFTVLLAAGLGVALVTAANQVTLRVVVAGLASGFLLRFWFASRMYETGTVQLWPRTTVHVLYCLLVASALGAVALARRGLRWWSDTNPPPGHSEHDGRPDARPRGAPARSFGVLAAAALVLGASASSHADRHFPRNDNSAALLAWVAHTRPLLDGSCPSRAPEGTCTPRD